MMSDPCNEMQLLVQADVDDELSPAEAARVVAHLEGCGGCRAVQTELLALSGRLRREVPNHKASDRLRAAVRSRIAAAVASKPGQAPPVRRFWRPGQSWRVAAPFAAGMVLAACLVLAIVGPGSGGLQDAVVAGHIRALQPGHLMDVASTDQHTVKPWFNGRLDYAPPVQDFAADGFPLMGGRLDYLAGRPVAVLVYRHRQHLIDLFVWPDDSPIRHGPADGSRGGYNVRRWNQDGMVFWAASDLNAEELADFVRLWQPG